MAYNATLEYSFNFHFISFHTDTGGTGSGWAISSDSAQQKAHRERLAMDPAQS
jgi:hypothetical protein